jgi:hypothetical protein
MAAAVIARGGDHPARLVSRAPVAPRRHADRLVDPRLRRVLFLAGLAISLLMVARTQVGGDQLDLLARGWRLAARGDLVPYGNPLSNGGNEPGALTSVIVGLPLLVRMDHVAPVVLVWLTHLLAWFLLDRTMARALGGAARARTLFCLFYWLSPWQLYYAGVLWNPSYLFLVGAVHLATSFAQRERARFGASCMHALALGLAVQLHPQAMILIFASAFLLWRRYFRLRWPAFALGAGLSGVTLVPWVQAALVDRSILPGGTGFPFRGLVLVQPMLRGVLYWLRYPTFLVMDRMERPDFTSAFGAGVDRILTPLSGIVRTVAGWGLLLLVLALTVRLVRRYARLLRRPLPTTASGRTWLIGYTLAVGAAALLSFAASPTSVMGWQGFIALHAAVLPLALGLEVVLRAPRWRRAAVLVPLYGAVAVLSLLGMALASPDFRCGGRGNVNLPLVADHPMFHDLGISDRCPFPVDPAGGWWPDALPRE